MITRMLVRLLDKLNRWLEEKVVPWAAKEGARRVALCRAEGHVGKGPMCPRCGETRPDWAKI